ncbi:DUF1697 domain-containing protein [Phaeovulum sp. W22_SRMD_FR3]|uniref:DUF1697 domain-containing protein n=1 Tax=Phaeovulum sp. W22_SRMD_FR3 TaxID=3240274 RepID=UPI003F97AA70
MHRQVALIRAVNVGGHGTLAMADLRALCAAAGGHAVQSYIASGNLVYETDLGPEAMQAALTEALERHCGQRFGVMVRGAEALAEVLAAQPFGAADPAKVAVIFLPGAVPAALTADLPAALKGQRDEVVVLGAHEIYVHYPQGMGRSRLVIQGAEVGTARNLNTVAKLVALSSGQTSARG